MIPVDPAERTATAAEYVIGTLVADERAEFEQALARDAGLQQEVYFWQDKLLAMTRMLAPVEPPPVVWSRIDQSLQRETAVRRAPAPRVSWWDGFSFWRFGAVAASVLAVVVALRVTGPAVTPAPGARYFAVLQSPDKQDAGWIVEAAAGGKLRLIPLGKTAVAPQKALQFWTKPQGASAPTSLGLVSPDRVTEIDVARLPALEREQLFELTLEPETGSPIGRPTGPILYVGRTVVAAAN
jgi:anti-sigma-K factor RskA